jgi:hypothetical protein
LALNVLLPNAPAALGAKQAFPARPAKVGSPPVADEAVGSGGVVFFWRRFHCSGGRVFGIFLFLIETHLRKIAQNGRICAKNTRFSTKQTLFSRLLVAGCGCGGGRRSAAPGWISRRIIPLHQMVVLTLSIHFRCFTWNIS